MKHFSNQSNGSHVDRMNYGGAKFCRFALFPLMLLMLLLLPGRMVAQTDYEEFVTLKELKGNPEGYDNESYANLFDGNNSKWCCEFDSEEGAYVIFKASKAGIPVGYTITTGNDNEKYNGRNPKSWKLYGNNTGSNDAWELIDEVNKDKVLQDKNNTSYNFDCKCSTSYQYFKWEISAIHRGSLLQVGEFELKLNTCSHKNADGSSALGEAIKTVEATCIEYGYTTHECSICHSIVKVDKDDELNKHTLTRHAQEDATCLETGKKEYWQCSVCNKLFSDDNATTEITDAASLEIPAKGHQYNSEGICTGCGATEFRYPLFNNLDGITDVTITDNDDHPWQKLDLKADGMDNLGFTIPEDSKGLMSGNYHKPGSSSETVIRFNVSKPILLTSQILVSSEENKTLFDFYVDNNKELSISGKKQTEYKVLLSVGEHSLRLVYKKGNRSDANADRAFLYNLKTSVTIDDYVADYESSNNTLTFKKVTSNNIESLDLNHAVIVNKPTVGDMCRLLGINSTAIKSVVFDKSFKTYAPTSLYGFFRWLTKLETIKDLKYLNTEQVTNMSYMFSDCSALTSLDLSNFNTAKVRDMSYMFFRCSALSSLDLSNFNTAIVTNMSYMFSDCSTLSSLDLSNFNTAIVTNMSYMFNGCSALSSLDLSNFNTAIVTNMSYMFFNCANLSSLDLTNFSTGNVTDMNAMFGYCQLSSLDLTSFNTANVTNMYMMFISCQNLSSLDLTSFNTANVTEMNFMFQGCSALTTIYASEMFVTDQVEGYGMFKDCTNLKDYSAREIDSKYANYKTGYFCKLVGKNGDDKIGAAGETLATDNLVLDDGKDFVAYEPFAAKAASYSRKMKEGTTWATLCLPFEVSLANQNFRAFKLLSADDVTETVELEEIEGSIAAGTPVIIKMNDGATELKFTEADKEIAKDVQTAETADANYKLQGIYTKKEFSKDTDNNCYIVKGAKLMNPAKLLDKTTTEHVGSKPFRAYMVDNSSAPAAGARMFSISVGGSTTAIEQLETTADSKAEYYDLQGRRLQNLQKGVNIVKRGGKTMKVIIK